MEYLQRLLNKYAKLERAHRARNPKIAVAYNRKIAEIKKSIAMVTAGF